MEGSLPPGSCVHDTAMAVCMRDVSSDERHALAHEWRSQKQLQTPLFSLCNSVWLQKARPMPMYNVAASAAPICSYTSNCRTCAARYGDVWPCTIQSRANCLNVPYLPWLRFEARLRKMTPSSSTKCRCQLPDHAMAMQWPCPSKHVVC